MAAIPVVKAFLVADAVIQDRATGKWSVIGVFDQIYAAGFPCFHPSVAIYAKLADAHGRYKVRVEFRDADDAILATFEGMELQVADATKAVEFGVTTQHLPLKRPGRYEFQLYLNGEWAAATMLEVFQIKGPPAPGPAAQG
jgi:hypothetical protein